MRLHHIGIITEDIERSILSHRTLFGLEPITETPRTLRDLF
jgi:catechol 2,3-dioxygenase-like lactoylglutathione lyase family enzyme